MKIELTEDNLFLYAAKHYYNPKYIDAEEFEEDLKRFKYIKRLLKKYLVQNELKHHLILNHMIICFNVFGEATVPLLFFKIEEEYWSLIKTFLLFLNRIPDYPKSGLDDIPLHDECNRILTTL